MVRTYADLGIPADVSPFFTDMASRIGHAHLVISRSGASTVSEVSVIGRPSVLVPYPYALDHDQAANAAALASGGGAKVICLLYTSAFKERNDFTRFAVAGLVLQLGIQSMINIGVNLELLPAKGMTLPLISYCLLYTSRCV